MEDRVANAVTPNAGIDTMCEPVVTITSGKNFRKSVERTIFIKTFFIMISVLRRLGAILYYDLR